MDPAARRRHAPHGRGPRAALPRRRGGRRRADRARARLAAALVDLAPRRAAARAPRAPGDDRPARLRLVRRAARRLRQADAGRRRARRARRARARARVPDGARLGRLERLPGLPGGARALRGLPRPGRPAPRRPAERAPAARGLALRLPGGDRRSGARPAAGRRRALHRAPDHGGAVRREAWTPDDLRAFTAALAEPAARAGERPALPDLPRCARSPAAARAPARCRRGSWSAAAIPPFRSLLLDGAERDADDLAVEIVPDCGHFVPEEHPALVAERARALFGLR